MSAGGRRIADETPKPAIAHWSRDALPVVALGR
jgi:hypothetical protein